MYKKILILLVIIDSVFGYIFPKMCIINNNLISRKNFIKNIIIGSIISQPIITKAYEEDNRPLTPEEMKEYQKLLKEAEKIKSIIKANKDALVDINEKNGIEEYLEKNNITKSHK
jgi:hypothetical protein